MLQLILTALTLLAFVLLLKIVLDRIIAGVLLLQQERSFLERQAVQASLTLQAMMTENEKIEKQAKLMVNSMHVTKGLVDRIHDPEWMKNFEKGRENAQWN